MNKIDFSAKKIYIFLALLLIFISCQVGSNNKKITAKQKIEFNELKNYEDSIFNKGKIATSLKYEKQDGSTYQVSAHLSDNDDVLMLEEKIYEPKTFLFQANLFYFKKGNLYASKELIQKSLDSLSSPVFTERISFYKDNKVVSSFEKNAKSDNELIKNKFHETNKMGLSYEKAQNALNQQGEFVTTFQGFVFHNNTVYIVVGAPGDESYSTALRVNNKDDLVMFLLKDQKKYLNRKLKIIFEIIEEENGFSYQSYLQGTFSD